ncbi:glycoside hydrolase family 52 protein [Streptomyces sp. NPDC060194]|uniref:glycoside hydrolase family 52 protein n=1 Tax=Streptomyces sp. NPDC060194 TaxID=3347069 RepID=UPI003653A54B
MTHDIFYNTHHSPAGAFASFTLGFRGANGGLGLELAGPAGDNVWIGAESADGSGFEALPFFTPAADDRVRFGDPSSGIGPGTAAEGAARTVERPLTAFADDAIRRELTAGRDTWRAGDLTFTVRSPTGPLPDPDHADDDALREAYVPAVLAELTLDNTAGTRPRRVFLGYQGSDRTRGMRHLEPAGGVTAGVGQGRTTALATGDPGVRSAIGLDLEDIVGSPDGENWDFGLGAAGALVADVPAGERRTLRVAVCFHRAGTVTTGVEAAYLYTRWFPAVEDVAAYAVGRFDALARRWEHDEAPFAAAGLSEDQRFMLAHAVRGYFASTQALDAGGSPLWVVHEGEYRMMNTFDLTADHVFLEARQNPWVIRNVLDRYAERYSYEDTARLPGSAVEHPGGIAFTHDMGFANAFSPPGRSSYERSGSDGLFSQMSHEQLVNWVLCAGVYAHASGDGGWLAERTPLLARCLESMLGRDHPDPSLRDGVMSLDGSRCGSGAEITTYDSLDASLGRARRSAYLAVKTFAAYVWLGGVLDGDAAAAATAQARRCADTVLAHRTPEGLIPALLEQGARGVTVPVIEGLAHLWAAGRADALAADGPYGDLVAALRAHLDAVLVKGTCLFDDGGWKLSATSDNSWLSKIYLCQFVARHLLGRAADDVDRAADAAHRAWLLHPEHSVWAWSDQMLAGEVTASRYYPRGVTAVLWLSEHSR